MHTPGPDLERDFPYGTVCTTWYVFPPSPPRPYPTWNLPSTSRDRFRGGGEEEDGDVREEVKFGESKGGGYKGNIGGGGDGGSGEEVDDSFLGKIFEGYSHHDPKNHQNNISCLNEDIVFRLKLDTELSSTRKDLTKA